MRLLGGKSIPTVPPVDFLRGQVIVMFILPAALFMTLLCKSCVDAQLEAVNVALNKPIDANITCGDPKESFTAHIEHNKAPQDRIESTCDASNASFAHPPENMVDVDSATGEVYSWWQSTSRFSLIEAGYTSPDSVIILDLGEVHTVESISIQMGDSVRPGQMGIQKSQDGNSFTEWMYQVSDLSECSSELGTPPVTAVTGVNTVLCTTFLSSVQSRNELIIFTVSPSSQYAQWQRVRYIKINFYSMPRTYGYFSDEFHHYTVRNIEVLAQCECNSHAASCTLQPLPSDPSKMTYQCVCGDNTQGSTCNECLPSYNQLAYQPGTDGFVCEACNCFRHSDVCVYDESVARVNGSLDSNGAYVGGGICQDCQNYTAGTNCHECLPLYHRPISKQQTDEDACQPCGCYLPGTREDSSIGLLKGECVMNDDVINPAGMAPGDCFCKVNVQGSKCDECQDGFYDLTDANTNGCLGCDCFADGTVAGSNTCVKNSTGQCPCKTFTTGRRCDQCVDGYYDLSASNGGGCVNCGCDVGGAASNSCDQESGVCPCKALVTGQRCDSVVDGAFYPTLHSISAEFESINNPYWKRDITGYMDIGYVELAGMANTSTILTVPPSQFSGQFHLMLRVITEGDTNVGITIQPTGELLTLDQTGSVTVSACPTEWCYDGIFHNDVEAMGDLFLLEPGQYRITTAVNTQGGAKVLLDQIIAIPLEYLDPTPVLGDQVMQFASTCDLQTNDMRLGTADESYCLANVFSLTMFYYGEALSCDCDLTGSVGLTCESFGGQCLCKAGISGRTCDACLPEYFSFRSTGCSSCDCYGDDKVCDMVTGQCSCPPNTAGRRCDRCVTFTWGLNSTTGCKACSCDSTGSVSLQCDQVTGQCPCHPGVGGRTCSECQEGYTGLTGEGCVACRCDPDGSLSDVCSPETGQCLCKNNTEGLLCDTCKAGSFYNSEMHATGCLDCVCMGITNQCDSTTQRSIQYTIPTNEGGVGQWEVVDPLNPQAPPTNITATDIDGTDYISVVLGQGADADWRYSTGSLLGSYGQPLTFELVYYVDGSPADAIANEAFITLQGESVELTYSLGTLTPADPTLMGVELTESSGWVDTQTGQAVSRAQYLRVLTEVTGISVTASLTTVAHNSSIGRVSYYEATSPEAPSYDATAPRALAVEECSCGPEYTGLSCEECAAGFYRVNTTSHSFYGVCVACECNGHSSMCDPNTGQCLDCQDNTGGFNCEVCLDGYYGDATSGSADACRECPCGPPTAVSNLCAEVSGVVMCLDCAPGHLEPLCDRCADFYYGQPDVPGGFCQSCDCNGNSESCDPLTGQCLGCQYSTTGFNCERCQNFTYGDASLQDCQACECDMRGSTSLLCNHTTSQCPCLSGVGGARCDACNPNAYGFGDPAGCMECGCNEFGSTDLQCDGGGVCTCLAGVLGDKCDACEGGSYGLPTQTCIACGCNSMGSVDGSQSICDVQTGQCPCKTGVTGRLCDACLPGYVNFTADGCTTCDQCVETLYDSMGQLEAMISNLGLLVESVEGLQGQDVELRSLDPETDEVSRALNDLLEEFSILRSEVEAVDSQAFQDNVSVLAVMALELSITMATLYSQSVVQLEEVTLYQSAALATLTNTLSANETVQEYLDTMRGWDESAAILVTDSMSRRDAVAALTVAGQQASIETELDRSRNVSLEADALLAMVMAQGQELNRLIVLVSSAEDELQAIRQLVTLTHNALDAVEAILRDTDAAMNYTQTNQAYSNRLLSEAETVLDGVLRTIAQSTQAITDADQAIADAYVIYLGSSQGNEGIPIDSGVDQMGVNGWVIGRARVIGQLGDVQGLQGNLEAEVTAAEARASELTNDTQQTVSIFETAKPVGQLAVDAVQGYSAVVTTVEESRATAQNASVSVASTQTYLTSRPIAMLSEEAQASSQASTDLKAAIEGSLTDTQALNETLNTASETLQSAVASWDNVRSDVTNLETEVNALRALADDPDIQPGIDEGMETANETRDRASAVLDATNTLDQRLAEEEASVVFIQENINNASVIISGLPDRVTQVETEVQTLKSDVATIQDLQNATSILRSGINDRIARLREKLRLAQDAIADSDQPVRLAGQSSLSVVRAVDKYHLYNEIQLDVRPEQRDGLVFFTENPERNSFLSIEIIASRISFRFRVYEELVTVSSPIDVCCGEWYRVLATRYADGGELTVTLLSTGGSSMDYARSYSAYDRFMQFLPNTTFYVGGVPQGYQTDNLVSQDFEGCITGVTFGGEKFDLWRPDNLQGSVSCCTAPVTPDLPEVVYIPGVSFDGFGYYRVAEEDFDVFQQASVSLEFRTVLKEGVLFSVTRPDLISYIGIFIVDGRVIFEMNTAGNARYSVRSVGTYDDGQWYQVTAGFNSSYYELAIRYVNESSSLLEGSTRRTLAPLQFPNLQFSPKVTLAGADPDQPKDVIRGPTRLGFAGSIRNVLLSNASTMALSPRDITNATSLPYKGVSFNGYPEQVVPGIGFSGDFAYTSLRLSGALANIQTVSFRFKTMESSGILLYGYDTVSFNKLLYVTLYHGNIFVQYNLGSGLSDPMQTRGLKLNTGQWQEVMLDFDGLTASMKVNSLPIIYGASQLSAAGIPLDGYLYLGGVTSTIPILFGGDYPVRHSLEGDVDDFTINDILPNMNDPDVIFNYLGVDLTGVQAEVATLPPSPYSTAPTPTGSDIPQTCGDPVQVFPYPEGLGVVRFGEVRGSYLAVGLGDEEKKYFRSTFVLTFQFRALSPDGVLLYMANDVATPTQFLALAMEGGHLNLFVLDRSRTLIQAKSSFTYQDSVWRTLSMLRINGFVVLLVTETKDYLGLNYEGISNTSQILEIDTPLFVGGVAPAVLAGEYPLLVEDSFNGCVRDMVISTETRTDIAVPLNSPDDVSVNVTTCRQNPIGPGGYFDGTGWLLLNSNYSLSGQFSVSVTVSTSEREALLLATAADTENFVVLELADGAARAVIGLGTTTSVIVRSTQLASGYDLCDGIPHTIQLTIQEGLIEMTVDEYPADSLPTGSQLALAVPERPLYIGGVSSTNDVPLIPGIITSPFLGCMETLIIDGSYQQLHNHASSQGFTIGCPYPLP